ncbi:hypothetical protein SAMN05421538_101708 [Paracoccus isoporae]|uniref:DUF998 domain-containing protein n=1 Tax=Paracoccus isoporae TaxID=591205 RepID=A0A1G6V737_9RHOB|nr:hypothetical protein [Paracoccus isoporae]SDD48656.1 hypothetical protein SAMN05421538_101708 [Paracoccus isoporae]
MAREPETAEQAGNDLVLSFLAVRRAIGYLGFFLPIALILYGLFSADGILSSISAYYFSPMRDVLVGTLCAQAVFLWSYEGYRPSSAAIITDRNVARAAAFGALGVAFLPMAEADAYDVPQSAPVIVDRPVECTLAQCVVGEDVSALLHSLSAGLFFGALAVFCLVLFVRGSRRTAENRARHRIYRICGWLILASISAIGILKIAGIAEELAALRPVLWLEVVACFAFATSWVVKGRTLRPLVRMAIPKAKGDTG